MRVEKINDKLELDTQKDVELQGCLNDCKEYFGKSSGSYSLMKRYGYKMDGTDTAAKIRECKSIFGAYCYRSLTAKLTYLW